jgi:membrane protein involved in colicin uptake
MVQITVPIGFDFPTGFEDTLPNPGDYLVPPSVLAEITDPSSGVTVESPTTGANVSGYYDVLRSGDFTDDPISILQGLLSNQGYITTGADMADGGAYGPVEDKYIVPGGIDSSIGAGAFVFDKTLKDFGGYDFDFGNISNKNLKKFQEELMPVMAPAVAQAQLEGQSYQNALIQAYERSPQVQEIYAKYNISPKRISRNNASEYLYDPFTFSEIQTVDRSKGFMDYVGDAVTSALPTLALTAIMGPLASKFAGTLTAPNTFANTTLSNVFTSAGVSAAQGADLKDALTAGLTTGIGAYASPYISDGLKSIGVDDAFLRTYNIKPEEFYNSISGALLSTAAGGDLEDSMVSAAVSYLRRAGVPGVEEPAFVENIREGLKDAEDVLKGAVPEPILEVFQSLDSEMTEEEKLQFTEKLSFLSEAFDPSIEPDEELMAFYDRMIETAKAGDQGFPTDFNNWTRDDYVKWMVNPANNVTQSERDYWYSQPGASKYRALYNTLGPRSGRPPLNLDPAQRRGVLQSDGTYSEVRPATWRTESKVIGYDKNGNIITDGSEADIAYEIRQFPDGTYEEIRRPDVTVSLDTLDTQGGGGDTSADTGGSSGSASGEPTTAPTTGDTGDTGGATGGGMLTGGQPSGDIDPDVTPPATGGGSSGGGGTVVVSSGGADGDTTEVQTPAPTSEATYSQSDLDDAIAEALAEAQQNDPTQFDQADLDSAIADAVKEVQDNDPTRFDQEDVNTAVEKALTKQAAEYEQEITELEGKAEAARLKAAADARAAAEAKAKAAATSAAKQSQAKIDAANKAATAAEDKARQSQAEADKAKSEASKAQQARSRAEQEKAKAEQEKAKAEQAQKAAEQQQREAEDRQRQAEKQQADAEAKQAAAEARQREAEQKQSDAEAKQAAAEAAEAKAEAARAKSEAAKAKAEARQAAAESERDSAKKAQKQAEADAAKAEAAQAEAEATAQEATQANKEAQDKKADADAARENAAKAREAADTEIDAARKAQKQAEADAAEARADQKAAEAKAASDAAEAANQAARDAEAAYEAGYGAGQAEGTTDAGVSDGGGSGGGVGTGVGTGTGAGTGAGTGDGSGDGTGLFAGLGGVTGEIFDDYLKFKKSGISPTRRKMPALKGYTAPQAGLFRNIL